jgi:hypothetical protein
MQGVHIWISVLQTCAADIAVLIVNDVRYALAVLLDLVGHHYAQNAAADGENFELARLGVLKMR